MNIEDILKGPQRRKKTIQIDGLPQLVLHELTAKERWEIADKYAAGDEITPEYSASVVLRSLLEFKRDPTEDELKQFIESYSHDVLESLFESLMKWAAIDENAVEKAKKG